MSFESKRRNAAGDFLSLATANESGLPRKRHDQAEFPKGSDEASPKAQKERCTAETSLRPMKRHDTIN
jgi:hypothetical protein